ncbi:MAG: hypothetical protein ACRDAP_01820, partial [Shewanella sp.]
VLRAFCATYVLWHGVLITFGFLLGMNPKSVQSWYKTLPETPTVVAREARGDGPFSDTAMAAPLSIRLPMDVLSWPEMARFLREQFSMQLAPPEARAPSQAAEANSASESDAAEQRLIMRFSFTESFICRQENELAKLMCEFNQQRVLAKRKKLFAKIVCVLKGTLPFGAFHRVCELLGVGSNSISGWYSGYRKKIAQIQADPNQVPLAQLSPAPTVMPVAITTLTSPASLQAFAIHQTAPMVTAQHDAATRSPALRVRSATVVREQEHALPASALMTLLAQNRDVQSTAVVSSDRFTPAATVTSPSQTQLTPSAASVIVPPSAVVMVYASSGAPATTDTATRQITTQTAAQQGAANATAVQAPISAASAVSLPNTGRARQRAVRASPSSARVRRRYPYGGERGARATVTNVAAAPQAVAPSDLSDPPFLVVRRDQNSYNPDLMRGFFQRLSASTGIVWNGNYAGTLGANSGEVTRGAVSVFALSFPVNAVDACNSPEVKELLRRINNETQESRRKFLLVKALRAFNETTGLWSGALTAFGFLLGMNATNVNCWVNSLPSMETTTAGAVDPLSDAEFRMPLTLRLPVDVLSLPEMLRFLSRQISLVRSPSVATSSGLGAATASTSS